MNLEAMPSTDFAPSSPRSPRRGGDPNLALPDSSCSSARVSPRGTVPLHGRVEVNWQKPATNVMLVARKTDILGPGLLTSYGRSELPTTF